ncbi:hypothetical protein E4S40_10120 [Algoriphagus kandeliae]|uniref:Lipoprotein n=1 Tax=Algoriphagus kandeliae TaxID=2562278 RepID=A0A4Y9QRX1_9BACT|nr:hypothetical protein [Algoriphagus kandeliae]TFV94372.1 hypothetical protein E4S40_10120 [Algoriphagus kandeliae]
MKTLYLCVMALLIMGCSNSTQEELQLEIDELQKKNEVLNTRVRELEMNNELIQKELTYWYDDYDEIYFKSKGIENPVEFVDSSLRAAPELIPLKAVLGGTMHFSKIQLLSKCWLIADYEDGHILGRSLYEFELQENGKLKFKLIQSIKD